MSLRKDGNSVEFVGLHIGLAVDPETKFNRGEFTYSHTLKYHSDNKDYPMIKGLILYCDDDANHISQLDPNDMMTYGSAIAQYLRRMYTLAEEIITAVSGKYLTHAYFDKPITCIFKGKEYCLDDMNFNEKDIPVIHFPKAVAADLTFLNAKKNPRRLFHFYRLANDVTLPVDQRVLMAWRFLECYFGKKDTALINHLASATFIDKDGKSVQFRKSTIEAYYRHYRSAVAHATGSSNPNHSKKVIYPRARDTTFNLPLHRRLFDILEALDIILATNKRVY